MQRYLSQRGDSGMRNAAALAGRHARHVRQSVGRLGRLLERRRRPGERRARQAIAGIDAQAVRVRARRSIRACCIRRRRCATRRRPSARSRRRTSTAGFSARSRAQEALIRSRNIPAIWVAAQLKQPSLYQFLQSAGVRDLKPESFYGLALTLGGGEVTMEELTGLYAMLANQGRLQPLRVDRSAPQDDGVRLLSPEASFITLDMLRRNPRPDDDGMVPLRSRWPVAWKTGHLLGLPRRLVGRHRRPVRPRRLDRQLQRAGQSRVRRRRCRRAAVLPDRRRAESRAAGGSASRRWRRRPAWRRSRCARAAATCRTPSARTR